MSWKEFKIKEVINHFQNGYAFKASKYTNIGIPIISMQSISLDGEFQLSEKNNCWDAKEKEKLRSFILKKGDLIMSMTDVTPQRNLIGCSTIINREGVFFLNQRVGKLEPNSFKVDVNFLDFYFKSNHWRNYCRITSSLSVQANIGTRDILNGKIKLPPKPEQTAIATILSKVDEAIEATRQSIKAASRLKKALMQNLLTGKLKPDGTYRVDDEFYEDEKFGKVPVGWEVKKLKDIANCLDSLRKPIKVEDRKGMQGIYPYYGAAGIIDYINKFIFDGRYLLFGEDGENLISRKVPQAFIVEGQFWVNNHAHILKEIEDVSHLDFLCYSLESKNYENIVYGSAQPKINKSDLNKIKLIIPNDLSEQKLISTKLIESDNLIQRKQTKIQTLQRLKKSLMQNLLTGKVRLNIGEVNKIISEQANG